MPPDLLLTGFCQTLAAVTGRTRRTYWRGDVPESTCCRLVKSEVVQANSGRAREVQKRLMIPPGGDNELHCFSLRGSKWARALPGRKAASPAYPHAFGLDSEEFFHPGRARNSHRRSLSGAAAAGILCFLVAFDMKLKKAGSNENAPCMRFRSAPSPRLKVYRGKACLSSG